MPTLNPAVAAFIKDNGDHVTNESGHLWIFETGATMENCRWGAMTPAFMEVDARQGITEQHVKKTLQHKLYYAQKKLGHAIREFEEMKAELEARANSSFATGSYPPTDDEVQKLYNAKAEVEKYETLAEAVEAELHPPKPTIAPTPIDEAAREKSKAVLEEIKSIEV